MRGNMQPALHPRELETALITVLSDNQYPLVWYQKRWSRYIILAVASFLGYLSFLRYGIHPPPFWAVGSAFIVFISKVADFWSTLLITRLQTAYDARGMELTFGEANPYLPENPTAKDMLWGKSALFSMLAVVFGLLIPPIGWGLAASFFFVSLNNCRLYQQAKFELRLYDKLSIEEKRKEMPD